jgi:Arc/MetJ-type ribon-helix-helix transcriptional regulator
MNMYLSKDLEQFVHDMVRAGRYATEDDVINDALIRLKQSMPEASQTPRRTAKRARPNLQNKKLLTIEELHQQMMTSGLITQLPNPAEDLDDDDLDDQPVAIEGEPLSETIIRERR